MTLAGSFLPGDASVPLAESTANGCVASIASATLSGVSPPDRISGTLRVWWRDVVPLEGLAGAAALAGHVRVEHVEVGAERAQAAHRRGVLAPGIALITFAPVRRADLARSTPAPRRRAAGAS